MSDDLVVYWSALYSSSPYWDINHLYPTPKSLYEELFSKRSDLKENMNDYLRCPAASDHLSNTFVIRAPVDTHARLDFDTKQIDRVYLNSFEQRKYQIELEFIHEPTILNHNLIQYFRPIIFFTEEESLIATLTSPYFEKTVSHDYGCIVPGSFDIGKWFREMNMEFQLWPGVNEIKVPFNEAISYVRFETSKQVVLKRFIMNAEIERVRYALTRITPFKKFARLSEKYRLFEQSQSKQRVLKLIKDSLI